MLQHGQHYLAKCVSRYDSLYAPSSGSPQALRKGFRGMQLCNMWRQDSAYIIKLVLHDGRLALEAHVLVLPLRLQLPRLPHACLQPQTPLVPKASCQAISHQDAR